MIPVKSVRRLPRETEMLALGGIRATMSMVPDSRKPEHSSAWRASCEWSGQTFEAVSRRGVTNALCRELVAAGVPDGRMNVIGEDGKLRFSVPSIHEAAAYTYRESSNEHLRRVRFKHNPLFAAAPVAPKTAVELRGVQVEGSEPADVLGEKAA